MPSRWVAAAAVAAVAATAAEAEAAAEAAVMEAEVAAVAGPELLAHTPVGASPPLMAGLL